VTDGAKQRHAAGPMYAPTIKIALGLQHVERQTAIR
jgi:hypothetical protein